MKRTLWVILGVLLGLVASVLVSWAFNTWHNQGLGPSEEDGSFLIDVWLFGLLPVCVVVAGAVAFRLTRPRR